MPNSPAIGRWRARPGASPSHRLRSRISPSCPPRGSAWFCDLSSGPIHEARLPPNPESAEGAVGRKWKYSRSPENRMPESPPIWMTAPLFLRMISAASGRLHGLPRRRVPRKVGCRRFGLHGGQRSVFRNPSGLRCGRLCSRSDGVCRGPGTWPRSTPACPILEMILVLAVNL